MTWFLDPAACGATFSESTLETLQIFQHHGTLLSKFWNGARDENTFGLDSYVKEKVVAFVNTEFEKEPCARLAAMFMFRILNGDFMNDFVYLASHQAVTIEEFVGKSSQHELSDLRDAFQEYLTKCTEAACGAITKKETPIEIIPGDEASENRGFLHGKAMKLRREYALFHHLSAGWMAPKDIYKAGGTMSAIYQGSRAGQFVGTPGKDNVLLMLSADLLPTAGQFGKAESYKTLFVDPPDLKDPLLWMNKAKGLAGILLGFDGRVSKLRRALEDWTEDACRDSRRLLQGSILFAPPASKDVRYLGRKLAYSADH